MNSPASLAPIPKGYADWLAELKSRIHAAQQRATLVVNWELVLLYWQIGRDILQWHAACARKRKPNGPRLKPSLRRLCWANPQAHPTLTNPPVKVGNHVHRDQRHL